MGPELIGKKRNNRRNTCRSSSSSVAELACTTTGCLLTGTSTRVASRVCIGNWVVCSSMAGWLLSRHDCTLLCNCASNCATSSCASTTKGSQTSRTNALSTETPSLASLALHAEELARDDSMKLCALCMSKEGKKSLSHNGHTLADRCEVERIRSGAWCNEPKDGSWEARQGLTARYWPGHDRVCLHSTVCHVRCVYGHPLLRSNGLASDAQ